MKCHTRDFLETNTHSRQQIDALAYDVAAQSDPVAYDASFICGFNASYLSTALKGGPALTALREASKDEAHLQDCLAASRRFVPLILTSLLGGGDRLWSHLDHLWAQVHADDLKGSASGRAARVAKQQALVNLWCGVLRASSSGVAALIQGTPERPDPDGNDPEPATDNPLRTLAPDQTA